MSTTAPFTAGAAVELDSVIGELLEEFEAVVQEMSAPSGSARAACEPALREEKRRPAFSDGVTDSGIEDTDDTSEPSQASSLNASVEELNTAGVMTSRKAKLRDTSDLESFIENLDKEIAEM
ncbi:regulator of cell cycle RGCC-like isoform X1 [Pangasianodon hypophthalmus]|uniref:regulator of cell cycle RGCC-like isoform X1 n=1 Tax=Pangasianodon hypophthalmus TaxID=310915 RepID=UPI002306DE8A|nr:regulator of cell cycle RGCC-like isoform X1 [Pangasianodon hypophthalmus]